MKKLVFSFFLIYTYSIGATALYYRVGGEIAVPKNFIIIDNNECYHSNTLNNNAWQNCSGLTLKSNEKVAFITTGVNTIRLFTSINRIFESIDGGKTWINRNPFITQQTQSPLIGGIDFKNWDALITKNGQVYIVTKNSFDFILSYNLHQPVYSVLPYHQKINGKDVTAIVTEPMTSNNQKNIYLCTPERKVCTLEDAYDQNIFFFQPQNYDGYILASNFAIFEKFKEQSPQVLTIRGGSRLNEIIEPEILAAEDNEASNNMILLDNITHKITNFTYDTDDIRIEKTYQINAQRYENLYFDKIDSGYYLIALYYNGYDLFQVIKENQNITSIKFLSTHKLSNQ